MAAGEIQTWFCAESWTYDVNGPRRGCSHRRIMVVIVAIVAVHTWFSVKRSDSGCDHITPHGFRSRGHQIKSLALYQLS